MCSTSVKTRRYAWLASVGKLTANACDRYPLKPLSGSTLDSVAMVADFWWIIKRTRSWTVVHYYFNGAIACKYYPYRGGRRQEKSIDIPCRVPVLVLSTRRGLDGELLRSVAYTVKHQRRVRADKCRLDDKGLFLRRVVWLHRDVRRWVGLRLPVSRVLHKSFTEHDIRHRSLTTVMRSPISIISNRFAHHYSFSTSAYWKQSAVRRSPPLCRWSWVHKSLLLTPIKLM